MASWRNPDATFWSGKKVLLTGHTGFKGAWLSLYLQHLGADVVGLSDGPIDSPSLYELIGPAGLSDEILLDIRAWSDFHVDAGRGLAAMPRTGCGGSV